MVLSTLNYSTLHEHATFTEIEQIANNVTVGVKKSEELTHCHSPTAIM